MKNYSIKLFLVFIAGLSALIAVYLSFRYVYSPQDFGMTASDNGWIVYNLQESETLLNGDLIERVGNQRYDPSIFIAPFSGYSEGDIVKIEALRNGERLIIDFEVPSVSQAERLPRIFILLFWLPFWLCGLWIVYLVPTEPKSVVMAITFFFYAMWMAAGLTSSTFVSSASAIVHATTWLLVPLSIHTHWLAPYALKLVRRSYVALMYLLFIILGALEMLQLLPRQVFTIGTVLMVVAPFVLLAAHKNESHNHPRRLMLLGVFTLTVPLVAWLFITSFSNESPVTWILVGGVALLALPVYPLLYVYANYRHRLSAKGERRLWQGLATTVYICVMLVVITAAISVAGATQLLGTDVINLSLVTGFVIAIAVALGTNSAQSWMHRFTYGDFESRITTGLSDFSSRMTELTGPAALESFLSGHILPVLGVRESALYLAEPKLTLAFVMGINIAPDTISAQNSLMTKLGQYQHAGLPKLSWVRLAIPLLVEQKLVGIWLLGSRFNDEFYAASHIDRLLSLGNQVAAVVEMRRQQREIERQAMLVSAREKEAALGRIVSSIAHQFRNPLQVITGSIEAHNDYTVPAEGWLQIAHGRAAHLSDVVRSIQKFAGEETGGASRVINVNEAVEEALLLVNRRMKEHEIEVQYAGKEAQLHVEMGASELTQVIMNLLENASEAQTGGIVEINAYQQEHVAVVSVRDYGEGIKEMERIFEPLYTTKNGLGLGLWITRSIIERNRGSIEAKNLGNGAVFTIRLPAI